MWVGSFVSAVLCINNGELAVSIQIHSSVSIQ